jgi:hypothetical protein
MFGISLALKGILITEGGMILRAQKLIRRAGSSDKTEMPRGHCHRRIFLLFIYTFVGDQNDREWI